MVDNQHERLQRKISVNSIPRSNHLASKKGWSASCQRFTTGGRWSSLEKAWDINVLKLEAVRLAILPFIKLNKLNLIHIRIDKVAVLSYLLNMGGTQKKHLIEIPNKNLGLSQREENTSDSRIYIQS